MVQSILILTAKEVNTCMNPISYYFILGSTNFLTNEEPLEEVLRERIQYYTRTNKRIDFWLLPEPKFLSMPNFVDLRQKVPHNSLAIISPNKMFILWLKLRIHNVFIGTFLAPTEQIKSPLDFYPYIQR
jgi:hypothetical protein